MRIIVVLLCLALAGCATASGKGKVSCSAAKNNLVTVDQKELDNMISVFSEKINKDPAYAGAYYNRAAAYYHKKDYDKSWQDVHKARELNVVQKLGPEFDRSLAQLTEKLRKASGRDK